MKLLRLTIVTLGLLAFVSCENSTTMKSDSEVKEMIQSDSSASDYQNQDGKRANSDTINQSGSRPVELDNPK